MEKRIVPWVDPFSGEELIQENNQLIGKSSKYIIKNGIPNFVIKLKDPHQIQVKQTFGYKWNRTDFGQNKEFFDKNIKSVYLDMLGLSESDLSIFDNKIVLDVGVGSGSSARLWGTHAKEFHGIDISDAVYKAPNSLKLENINSFFAQADLNSLPYPDESFDVIVSNGVLHHTKSTKVALQNIIKKLKNRGLCLFYIYKKKSPLREYSDDYIRSKISDLPADVAWKSLESLTTFAQEISRQKITVKISKDLDLLGIKKGEYNLQRFLYQFFFKCFWNEQWGFEDSNMVNFDWYYPKYSWRQTEEEIKNWCKEFKLKIQYIVEKDSGYTCLVQKL
ncbi:MAG: class I SAM-dependent methyltransferase [Nitrosopumilaceae archaeon]